MSCLRRLVCSLLLCVAMAGSAFAVPTVTYTFTNYALATNQDFVLSFRANDLQGISLITITTVNTRDMLYNPATSCKIVKPIYDSSIWVYNNQGQAQNSQAPPDAPCAVSAFSMQVDGNNRVFTVTLRFTWLIVNSMVQISADASLLGSIASVTPTAGAVRPLTLSEFRTCAKAGGEAMAGGDGLTCVLAWNANPYMVTEQIDVQRSNITLRPEPGYTAELRRHPYLSNAGGFAEFRNAIMRIGVDLGNPIVTGVTVRDLFFNGDKASNRFCDDNYVPAESAKYCADLTIQNARNITIQGNTFRDAPRVAIDLFMLPGRNIVLDHVSIIGNNFIEATYTAIAFEGHDCNFQARTPVPSHLTIMGNSFVRTESGALGGNLSNSVISNNTMLDNKYNVNYHGTITSPDIGGVLVLFNCSEIVTIEKNVILNTINQFNQKLVSVLPEILSSGMELWGNDLTVRNNQVRFMPSEAIGLHSAVNVVIEGSETALTDNNKWYKVGSRDSNLGAIVVQNRKLPGLPARSTSNVEIRNGVGIYNYLLAGDVEPSDPGQKFAIAIDKAGDEGGAASSVMDRINIGSGNTLSPNWGDSPFGGSVFKSCRVSLSNSGIANYNTDPAECSPGACTSALSAIANFPPQSYSTATGIAYNGAACSWTAQAVDSSWVGVSPWQGYGNGYIQLSVPSVLSSQDGMPDTGSVKAGSSVTRFTRSNWFNPADSSLIFSDVVDDRYNAGTVSWFNNIVLMKSYQITGGCSVEPNKYCPNDLLSKGQFATFIVRASNHPDGNTLPFNGTQRFEDVPPSHVFFGYIQRLYDMGAAKPCGAGYYSQLPRFCSEEPISRGDVAELLIGAKYRNGVNFAYPSTPYFSDVAASHPQFRFIQKMREQGITSGTTATTYSPGDSLTRAQAAVMLIRAFFTLP